MFDFMQTDEQKLARARAGIVRCERRIKRTVTGLKRYRRQEAYYLRKQAAEIKKDLKPAKQSKRKLYL